MRLLPSAVTSSLVLITLALGACAAPSEPSRGDVTTSEAPKLARTSQRIVNGAPSTGDQDATVMLTQNGEAGCTGTLITPNLVLTARHCISNLDEESECGTILGDTAASAIGVALGVNASPLSIAARGKLLYLPKVKDLCHGADIALLQLDKDLPSAKRATLRFTPLRVGEPTVAVGYGDDGTGKAPPVRFQRSGVSVTVLGPANSTYKTKRGQSLPLELQEGDVATTESTCFGDSGGPLFDANGLLVGVTSRGIDEECIDRPTIWTGLPQWESLIKNAAKAAGHAIDEASADGVDDAAGASKPSSKDDDDDDDDDKPAASPAQAAAGCSVGAGARPFAGKASPLAALIGVAFAGALSRRKRRG